jgi:hypothetical protein
MPQQYVDVYCDGPRGGRVKEEEELIEYVEIACSLLKIKQADINIIVYNQFPKDEISADWLGCCYGSLDEGITIELTRDQEDMYQTLAHEMIHVEQFLDGRYPSEREAKRREFDLHKKVKELCTLT